MSDLPDAMDNGSGLKALAQFAIHSRFNALPADIREKAHACLLYGLSVGIASLNAEAPRQAAAIMDLEYDDPSMHGPRATAHATRFIDAQPASMGAAAFANAVLLHARVQEDAHPTGHVGVVVISTALAVAGRLGASGAELLAALVVGYEVALRIGRDHAADTSSRGFRTTPLYGAFGAAAATARLMRLDASSMCHALALAANTASGLREFVNGGTGEYPFHAGFAARNGITAASCARASVEAAASTLEGGAGFYRAYGEPGKDYGQRLAERLGDDFELRQVTYKPYPTCQFHRAVVQGVLAVRKRIPGESLQRMVVRMNPFEADFVGVRYAGPFETFAQTFMSAPFCAALAWSRGMVGFDGMHAFNDAGVLQLIPFIELVSDPACPRYLPHITVHCESGRSETWEPLPDAGGFEMTWEAAVSMAWSLGREVGLCEATVSALIAAVEGVEAAPDISAVIDAICLARAEFVSIRKS